MYWFFNFITNDVPRFNKLNWHNFHEISYCTPLTFLLFPNICWLTVVSNATYLITHSFLAQDPL